MLFGSLGLGYFAYGVKQRAIVPLVCGVVLVGLPYFVSNLMLMIVSGFMVIAVSYFVRY